MRKSLRPRSTSSGSGLNAGGGVVREGGDSSEQAARTSTSSASSGIAPLKQALPPGAGSLLLRDGDRKRLASRVPFRQLVPEFDAVFTQLEAEEDCGIFRTPEDRPDYFTPLKFGKTVVGPEMRDAGGWLANTAWCVMDESKLAMPKM